MLRHEAADVLQVPAQATQDEVSTRERKERERKVLSPVQSKRRRRRFFFISQPRPPTPFSLNPHTHSDRSAAPTSPRPAGPTRPRRERLGVQARRRGLRRPLVEGRPDLPAELVRLLALPPRFLRRLFFRRRLATPAAGLVFQRHPRPRALRAAGAGGRRGGARQRARRRREREQAGRSPLSACERIFEPGKVRYAEEFEANAGAEGALGRRGWPRGCVAVGAVEFFWEGGVFFFFPGCRLRARRRRPGVLAGLLRRLRGFI